jgi:hypothetical protein
MFEMRNPIRYFSTVGIVLLMMCSPVAQRAWAIRNAENSDVQDLLYQAREEAVGLDNDADQMEVLVRSEVDWTTHADQLSLVASHVNRLAGIIDKLQSEREKGSPWQQDAIDRITPLLREVSSNTTTAIQYLNSNQAIRPAGRNYATWLRENAESAHELALLISDTIKYGQTKSRLEKLAGELSVNKS